MKPEERCRETVYSGARWDFRGHRCSRRAVDSGYCRLHAERNDKVFQQRLREHEDELRHAAQKEANCRRLIEHYDHVIAHLQALGSAKLAQLIASGREVVVQERDASEETRKRIAANVPKRESPCGPDQPARVD